MNSPATAIVVGASSGIGAALARRLAADGAKVALVARRREQLAALAAEIDRDTGRECARAFPHDVRERAEVEDLWEEIEAALGAVGALYYASGVMPDVARDEFDTDKDAEQLEINALGCMAWCNAAARRFQERKRGAIIGISSVAQDRGRTGRPGYGASKAAMDHYLEALRNRLWRHGVQVTTIRPGFVQTPMTADVQGMFWVISAEKAAAAIVAAVRRRKTVAYVPARWRAVMFVIRNIPSFVFRKLNV
jgi:short-subunit dehydrogenase